MQASVRVKSQQDTVERLQSTGDVARVPTNSLERALLVFKAVGSRSGGLTNADLSRKLGIPRSSCSYLLTRLEQAGYLRRDADSNRYTVGFEALALANSALREMKIRSLAEPILLDIVQRTGLILHIGILESGRVLIVDRFQDHLTSGVPPKKSVSPRSARDRCFVGGELLPNTTALGKVLLAGLSHAALADLLEAHPLTGETTKSVVASEQLALQLEEVRRSGYATANGEHAQGLRALAVPLYDQRQSVCAAISMTGDESHKAWDDPQGTLALVRETATDLSRKLARVRD